MAQYVEEIMNAELFAVHEEERAAVVLDHLFALGITAAPVVDDNGMPVGVVSMRDLLRKPENSHVMTHMNSPAASVKRNATIEDAAKSFAESGHHHLVVVDDEERAVGFVGAVDVIRGLVGAPVPHPSAFPHLDPETKLVWTDEIPLDVDKLDAAPDGPGLLMLIHGVAGQRERVVWSEASSNVRSRLFDLVSLPQSNLPQLEAWMQKGHLRFRAASSPSARALAESVDKIRRRHGGAPNVE